MSIQSFNASPTQSWNVGLPTTVQPMGGTAPVAPVQAQPAQQAADPWANWKPQGKVFDHAYDAYMFTKFPLSLGGTKFWTGGQFRMKIASMFSKIPQERLVTIAVREQFMKVQGMTPDHARVLQMAYYAQLNADPALRNTPPLNWLSQFGGGGTMNDWLVRGPLIVTMNLIAAQVALEQGWAPDVPGNSKLSSYGAAAAALLPAAVPTVPVR